MEKSITKNLANSDSIIKNKKQNHKLSVCEVMKDNVCDVITKLESDMPIVFQGYSDLYSKYLHSQRDFFGVCHLAEKQYFDKFEVEPNVLKALDNYFKSLSSVSKYQIDIFQGFLKYYFKMRLSFIDSSEKYVHSMMDLYAKILSQFVQKSNTD